ncbi:uncharacterized protein LOC128200883 [Galleria mellonella]|uniref:Uncharacterized protein LOC128200883 n=1 Tax=Galleria mellonella TaxID=7137 RepID=A0ABM3MK84_GALME|nr:uncharacterized protein LOC128200883 [Galleria mellonella]
MGRISAARGVCGTGRGVRQQCGRGIDPPPPDVVCPTHSLPYRLLAVYANLILCFRNITEVCVESEARSAHAPEPRGNEARFLEVRRAARSTTALGYCPPSGDRFDSFLRGNRTKNQLRLR